MVEMIAELRYLHMVNW